MPNLKNKSIREAISVLSDLRIKYKIEGSGQIVSQSIEARFANSCRKGLHFRMFE